jgi:hypothetical protein
MSAKRPTTSSKTAKKKKPSRLPAWLTTDRIFIGGSILLTVGIVVIIMVNTSRAGYYQNLVIEGVETFPGLSNDHTADPVNYPQDPPVGGPHHPIWQQCRVYTEPIKNEHAIHALEHGAVWITYDPDLPVEQVQTLQNITQQGSHRLLSPYPGIDSPIILSAWGLQLRLDSVDDPRLNDFLAKYVRGPQTLEVGATCSGGETRTLAQINQG